MNFEATIAPGPSSGADSQPATLPEFGNARLAREFKTMAVMIRMYCRSRHRGKTLCAECRELLGYAAARLERCRFGVEKPTCANCPVHCYHPARREQMKTVMRQAGPQMLWRHPVLSLWHWVDGFRKAPVRCGG
jgi:hypothetical protein